MAQAATRRALTIEVGTGTMARVAAAVGLGVLLVILWPIVLVVAVALMMVGALAPPVRWLEQHGISRGPAIAVVFVAIALAGTVFAALTVPHLLVQLSTAVDHFPEGQARVAHQLDRYPLTAPLARIVRGAEASELLAHATTTLFAYSTKILATVAYAATAISLALYVMIDRDRVRGAVFALVPRPYHVRLSRILLNLETIVGGYVRGQMITSLMMAGFAFGVMALAGTPNAVALAALAAVADVLPYVGGVLICVPVVAATWSHGTAALAAIVPRVYGQTLRLSSTMVLIALLVGGTLLGILGALLALPVAAAIRMVVEELRFELPGEDGLVRPSLVARDALAERAFERRAAGAPAERAAAIATEIAEAQIRDDALRGDPTTIPVVNAGP